MIPWRKTKSASSGSRSGKKTSVSPSLRIAEYDESDNLIATYVESSSETSPKKGDKGTVRRVDVITPADPKSTWQKALDVFLPVGYPHSVSDDYLKYQIYDSLQAFSSSIAGLLSSRAVLSSVGVGDSSASPTAALLLSIFQESVGRIATILFAHRFGTALEPECKMYRLLADILNDTAFVLDCLSPALPKPLRVVILSASSVLRSLCGVAAGSAKASLSAHFAKWGNLGELNAKDSSQETVISLLGMLAGSLVVSWVTEPQTTWMVLILLLAVHLETNRRAVRAVCMRTMNRQRANLVFSGLQKGNVLSPVEVAYKERIFETDGALRNADGKIVGRCDIGVPVARLLDAMATERKEVTDAVLLPGDALSQVLKLYDDTGYILWRDRATETSRGNLFVVLRKGASKRDVLLSWWHAIAVATSEHSSRDELDAFKAGRVVAVDLLRKYEHQLAEKGWDLSSNALETVSVTRVSISGS